MFAEFAQTTVDTWLVVLTVVLALAILFGFYRR